MGKREGWGETSEGKKVNFVVSPDEGRRTRDWTGRSQTCGRVSREKDPLLSSHQKTLRDAGGKHLGRALGVIRSH